MKSTFSFAARITMGAVATMSLWACTGVSEKMVGWMASDVPALGLLDGRLLRGQASFRREREATVHLESSEAPSLVCFGPLSFTSTNTGVVRLACSDGRSARVTFRALGPLSGTGAGPSEQGAFALTYGLPPEQAAAALGVAPDRLLPAKPAAATATTGGG